MEESIRDHAILSASSAHRWLTCTPSARLSQMEQEEECSAYAAEGTAAHALAELKLSYTFGKISVSEYETRYKEFVETISYYNKSFEEYVDDFVDYVVHQTDELENYHIYFEMLVNFSNIVPQGFGTADVLIVTEDTVHVIDLKFGQGVPVSAFNNPQLRLYGMGALNLFPNTKYVEMTINQPRLLSCSSERLTKEEVLEWSIDYVAPRAERAIKGEGLLHASEDACRFCKVKNRCQERANTQLEIARQDFNIENPGKPLTLPELSPEQISEILQKGPQFVEWLKDVEAYAFSQLSAGVNIPGYKLVEGRSTRVITDPEKVKEIMLNIGLEEDEIMEPRKLLGISKLEALLGKKFFADVCQEYLIKPQGKLTLAPVGDRRPAVNTLAIAQNEFATPIENE